MQGEPGAAYALEEEAAHLGDCLLGRVDRVADRPRVRVELIVAAARQCLVAEEVDRRELALGQKVEAERLVPAAPGEAQG